MWLNAGIEKSWASIFGYDGNDKVVILNPGKRKRFAPHEGAITRDQISLTLENIIGGNARFTRVSDLPTFEVRAEWFDNSVYLILSIINHLSCSLVMNFLTVRLSFNPLKTRGDPQALDNHISIRAMVSYGENC